MVKFGIKGSFALVDVETTGGSPTRDRIIDIAIIRIEDGVVVETYQSVVDPEKYIPQSIYALTGITEADISRAPSFADIAPDVFGMLKGCIFVAHNARFDYSFIKNEFGRLDQKYSAKNLCTVKLSRKLFPKYRRHDLSTIIERHGFTCSARHRALGDAEVLVDFLAHCEKTAGP